MNYFKKLISIISIAFTSIFLFSCNQNPIGDSTGIIDSSTTPSGKIAINNQSSFGNAPLTNNAKTLVNKMDDVESLTSQCSYFDDLELTKVDTSNESGKKAKLKLLSNPEVSGDIDFTNPTSNYNSGEIYNYEIANVFSTNEQMYETALGAKNLIMNSCPIVNAWYRPNPDLDVGTRISFTDNNEILLEEYSRGKSYTEDMEKYSKYEGDELWIYYTKVLVEVDSNKKLHFLYTKSTFDGIDLVCGVREQKVIEYYEDQYYNWYSINRGWGDWYENGELSDDKYSLNYIYELYETDLSKDEPMFFEIYCNDVYTIDINTEEYEHIGQTIPATMFSFWFNDDGLVQYHSKSSEKAFSKGFSVQNYSGNTSFQMEYIRDRIDYTNNYTTAFTLSMNLYELNGISKITGTPEYNSEFDTYNYLASVNFSNGKTLDHSSYDPCVNLFSTGTKGDLKIPFMDFRAFDDYNHLTEKMNYYGVSFKTVNAEYYYDLLAGNTQLSFKEIDINHKDSVFWGEYLRTKVTPIDFNEIKKDYNNVDEIKDLLKLDISYSISGTITKNNNILSIDIELYIESIKLNQIVIDPSFVKHIGINYKGYGLKDDIEVNLFETIKITEEFDISEFESVESDFGLNIYLVELSIRLIIPIN